MLTLKHIAREYNLDPYALRQQFRRHLPHSRNQRWKFEPNSPQHQDAIKIAKDMADAKATRPK